MLAYVFSHRPAPGADVPAYEGTLRRFHAALAAERPSGFISSLSYRIGDGYSDWYLVQSSAALDPLNEAAVSSRAGARAHDSIAGMAADGVGKLMVLTAGEPDAQDGCEIRFAKPAGVAYAELYSRLERWTAQPRVSLWRRMMVLGPPPEFCLVSPARIELAEELLPEVVTRSPV